MAGFYECGSPKILNCIVSPWNHVPTNFTAMLAEELLYVSVDEI